MKPTHQPPNQVIIKQWIQHSDMMWVKWHSLHSTKDRWVLKSINKKYSKIGWACSVIISLDISG